MKTISAILFACIFVMVGCVSATISDPSVSDTQTITFGTIPPAISQLIMTEGANTPPQHITLPSQNVSYDFSSTLKSVSDVASDLQVAIVELQVSNTGDLNWLRNLDIQIAGSATDGSTPGVPLASYSTTTQPGSDINVDVVLDGATVLKYLSAGPITLTFTASGEVDASNLPSGTIANTVVLTVSVSGKFSKSL